MLEDGPQRQLDAESLADARRQADREQGVAAQGEEVVAAAEAGTLEQLLPDPARISSTGPRGGAAAAAAGASSGSAARALRSSLRLAVRGRAATRVKNDGTIASGMAAAQEVAQLAGRRRGAGPRHDPGGERVAVRERRRADRALGDAGVGGERRLHLAGLDAHAAHLELVVETAEELETAAGREADRSPVR